MRRILVYGSPTPPRAQKGHARSPYGYQPMPRPEPKYGFAITAVVVGLVAALQHQ
ncbi:MAG TPA: hypothetical protein VFR22_11400 [Nocardioidaceae bacterium]|nr:hypothetical protein [Nocardioidaceae bacterium]